MRLALKYCGSCNPYVNLPRIARHLTQIVTKVNNLELIPFSETDIDVIIILCGCPRACANKQEVRARAKFTLIIAGESVNGTPVTEENLPTVIEFELFKILRQLTNEEVI